MKATAFQLLVIKIRRFCQTLHLLNSPGQHTFSSLGCVNWKNFPVSMFKPDPKARKKQLVSFEILVKGVLQSRKCKNGCVCRTCVGCEAGLDLLVVLLLFLNKTNLSPDGCSPLTLLVPMQEDLCLFCCLVLLPWAGCWSLNLSPHRGGIFDKADVTKNAPLFHSVPFFACASRPSGISQTAVACCAQEGLLHPSRVSFS